MSLVSVAGLVDALRDHRLLTATQLELVTGTLSAQFKEPQELAWEMLRRGWLTQYQIKRLFQGRAAELVLGPYLILSRIGKGGMGFVYQARHQLMNRVVALKVIHKQALANPEAVQRFRREIELAAQLSHPNIVAAYDASQVDDRHFLVMEYVEGTDLHHLVEKSGPLPPSKACGYIGQAALGLQHAHERGLVHRDIKPSNLLVTTHGDVVKILDLGLARSAAVEGVAASQLTRLGTLVGTPDYIAPEQIANPHRADIRADIYSLGGTFYFLLAARPPFVGGTLAEKLCWHQGAEPPPVEQLRPDVPPAVGAVVRKMLAKRPEDRYPTPVEVAAALAPFSQRLALTVDRAGPVPVPAPPPPPPDAPAALEESPPLPPLPPWVLAAIGGGFLLLLVLLVLVWSMS
jgi:serine/threonine protein kinase